MSNTENETKQPLLSENSNSENVIEVNENKTDNGVVDNTTQQSPEVSPKCEGCKRVMNQFIPITKWMATYNLEKLKFDCVAGLTVGIMAIPQSMAYAMLAKLPPIYGLYCCIIPVFLYGIFGTSMQAHIGPFALVSMLVGSTVSPIVNPDINLDEYIKTVLLLSLLVGGILFLLGICRLGVITCLLSETVITAFTCSSAFNIGGSQLKHYFDAKVTKDDFLGVVIELFSLENMKNYNWMQFGLGISATILLYIMKELNKKYLPKQPLPIELVLVALYDFISWIFDLKTNYNIKILGDQPIPAGFPSFRIPSFDHVTELIPGTFIVAIISFVITFSLGKLYARKHNYHVDENQELIALGISNMAGSFLSCYPACGSLSRTALVDNLHAQTAFHNFVSPVIIIITLYTLTDIIKYLPNSTLAAIVEVNLISLFKQLYEIVTCYKVDICDFLAFLFCSLANICMGTEAGLIVGISTSLLCLLVKCSIVNLKHAGIKYNFGSNLFIILYHVIVACFKKALNIKNEQLSLPEEKYSVVILPSCVHFLNRDIYRKKIEKIIKENNKPIVLDGSSTLYIDMSSIMTFEELLKKYSTLTLYIKDEEVLKHLTAYGLISTDEKEAKKYNIVFNQTDILV